MAKECGRLLKNFPIPSCLPPPLRKKLAPSRGIPKGRNATYYFFPFNYDEFVKSPFYPLRHSRESGNPVNTISSVRLRRTAFAGVTAFLTFFEIINYEGLALNKGTAVLRHIPCEGKIKN